MNGYEKRMKIPNEIIISFDRLFIKAKTRMPSCLSSLIYKNGVKRRMQMNMYAANGAVTENKQILDLLYIQTHARNYS